MKVRYASRRADRQKSPSALLPIGMVVKDTHFDESLAESSHIIHPKDRDIE